MIRNAFILALRSIKRNLLRSFLTSLGIIIGVASVITMVTLGQGATQKVKEQISSLGSNLLLLRPGIGARGHGGGAREAEIPFKMEDVEAIKREVYGLEAVAPMSAITTQTVYGNKNRPSSITGTTNDFFLARDWAIEKGREFTEQELRAGAAVCIIGATVVKQLFGEEDPVGKLIRIRKVPFEVVGVLPPKGESSFGMDQDDVILVPIRTFQRRLSGNTDVSRVFISVSEGQDINRAKKDVEALMSERRRVKEREGYEFEVRDLREVSMALSESTKTLTSLLGAVAAVSLLVGGIGIMNIMLVSVTERTREIGIRMAVGALERDVLMQFLVESVVLASFGGVVGIILAIVSSYWLSKSMLVPFIVSPGIILLAFAFSSAIGIGFGFFPARKAARMNPIEALRHE